MTSSTRIPVLLLLLIAAGAMLVGCGDDEAADTATSEQQAAPATAAEECSATHSNVAPDDDEPDLPARVASTRERLLEAARACDFDELASITEEGGQFAYTFGDEPAGGVAAYWRSIDARDRILQRLVQLLQSPHAVTTEGPRTFVWPAAHAFPRPQGAWEQLEQSGAYTVAEIAAFARDDMYYGYRVGVLPDGTWVYFVAGD
ncbi:MAG: hypothetical protein JWO69_1372 [Thermoleophilia bacterium]|nr:hypothetical protein [Thermoleophilia bacterium]